MKYDVKDLPHKQLFAKYPDLELIYSEAKELHDIAGGEIEHSPLSREEVMIFIVYSYHLKSPIIKEMSIHKRRQQALGLLGYELNTREQIEQNSALADVIVGRNEFINRLSLHFCKFEQSFDWMELVRLQDMMDDVFLAMKESADGSKKTAAELLVVKTNLEKNTELYRNKIRALAQQIFSNDENLINLAPVHVILQNRRDKIISPERYAKAKQASDGKDIFSDN